MFYDYFKTDVREDNINGKLDAIKKNMDTARQMQQDIDKLKETQKMQIPENGTNDNNLSPKNLNRINFVKPLDLDIELENIYQKICILNINNYDDEGLEVALSEIIGENNIRYYALINKIKLKLYYEIMQYSQILIRGNDEDEQTEIKMIIETLKIKIEALKSLEQVKQLITSATPDNNFVFSSSELENIFILDSIEKDIPKELYFQVLDLILAMKNGIFRRVKAFKNVPYFETRISDIRVTFAKLNKNTYVLIDVYLKKDHNSEFYHNILVNRGKQYLAKRDYFLQNLDNPKFWEEQNQIYQKMLNLLQGRKEELDDGRKK